MKKYDLKDRRLKQKNPNTGKFEWLKYGDTYVAGGDSLGDYMDQTWNRLSGELKKANDAINNFNKKTNDLNKITKHLKKGPPTDTFVRKEWFRELKNLTKKVGIRFVEPEDKAAIESDLGVITSPTFSFDDDKNWEKQITDAVRKQEQQIKKSTDRIKKDNDQTYAWFQALNQVQSIDDVKQTLYEMSPEGFVDAIKNSTKGYGEETTAQTFYDVGGVKFGNIADPQFAEFVYEQEGASQLGLEVSQFLGKPPTPSEAPEEEEEVEQQAGNQNLGTVFAAIDEAEDLEEYQDIADFAGMFGGEASTAGLDVADSETLADDNVGTGTGTSTGTGSGSNMAALAAQQEADRDEIYQLLTEQFGGASYFFRNHATNMLIGITGDGSIVSYDDPEAETQKGLMDYIVKNGITSPARVKGLLQKTEWWQTTDKERRFFDVSWGEMSGPEQAEWLEPVTKALQDEAQYLGVELSDERAFELGQMLAMEGNGDDQEEIRKILFDEDVYTGISAEISGFAGAQDAVQQLAYTYYTPIDDDSARDWAEKIYTGESTQEEYEQFLKSTAVSRFPTLDKVINQMGVTPQQYFAPYKQQIEQMLGRQVDLLDEFSDVIEYMPDTGGTTSRPMTLSEVRKFVRATPEWQETDDAKDQARALAFSIGQSFGEVA